MQDVFDDARLLVEIAFGADLTSSPTGWDWQEVTADVQVAGGAGIHMTRGRSNEASDAQPATCTFRLNNASGDYSQGVQAFWWPYIRRGTPVHVQVDPDGLGFRQRFSGFADSFQPMWDDSGNSAWVEVTASGSLRRISQGNAPITSAMTRSTRVDTRVVAYWPLEEGRNATEFATGLATGARMGFIGKPDLAQTSRFECTAGVVKLNDSVLRGSVTSYTGNGKVQLRFLLSVGTGGHSTDFVLASVFVSGGSVCRIDLLYITAGEGRLRLKAYSSSGSTILTSADYNFFVNGSDREYSLTITQSGADVLVGIVALDLSSTVYSFTSDTIAGRTVSRVNSVTINPNREDLDFTIGQVILMKSSDNLFEEIEALNAYASEPPSDRFPRICNESVVFYAVYDVAVWDGSSIMLLGSQGTDPLLTLVRDIEAADGGILFDGDTEGLSYRTLRSIENGAPVMTLDAAVGDLGASFTPLDDDQFNRNRVQASRDGGAGATVEDTDGPLGTDTVGIYDESVSLSIYRDERAVDEAGWRVNLGTVEGYRYPAVDLDFRRSPELAADWTRTIPGDRIDIENIAAVRAQHPDIVVPAIVVGCEEFIDQFTYTARAVLAPFQPYRVGVAAATTGDTGEYVFRLSTDGSTLASSVTSGASSLSVATPSGPLWTTAADDLPLSVSVEGIEIEVTAISGTTSPQTFTVNPATVTRNLSSGQDVDLWYPTVPGL